MPSVASEFLKFVDAAPSPFHAVDGAIRRLLAAGYSELREGAAWDTQLVPGGRYFFTRNRSAIIAFAVGGRYAPGNGFSIIGGHVDSPCLKVKPRSRKDRLGHLQVGVELYGGGLWHTWFDRDLSVAGRVLVEKPDGTFDHRLAKIDRPILRIPTLAIHLDRQEDFKFNKEVQLTPVLAMAAQDALNKKEDDSDASAIHQPQFLKAVAENLGVEVSKIRDFELCLFDTQPAAIGGVNNEFIFSSRQDNLMMSFCALTALIQSGDSLANDSKIRLIGLFDNEEVGSTTAHGANSNLLETTLKRLSALRLGSNAQTHVASAPAPAPAPAPAATISQTSSVSRTTHASTDDVDDVDWVVVPPAITSLDPDAPDASIAYDAALSGSANNILHQSALQTASTEGIYERSVVQSLLISADMAHGLHPNYTEKHEENHRPLINKGVVIKQNANQRYATTAVSTLVVREVAKKAGVPVQEFVVRNDSPCGSTIGPMISSNLGIRTVDLGNPQWSMHSIRETCGVHDTEYATSLFKVYLPGVVCQGPSVPINQVCETKSQNAQAPSSEGTGCENIAPGSVTDGFYKPPSGQGDLVPGANYIAVTAYNTASTCDVSGGAVQLQQTTYATNGCFAFESGYYFKATCTVGGDSIVYNC
eukprot:jgi/Hompol1/1317/HPOL_005578-RA